MLRSGRPITLMFIFTLVLANACDRSSKPAAVKAAPETPAFVSALNTPLAECPERIWPDADEMLADAQVLVMGLDPDWAFLWEAAGGNGSISSLPATSLSSERFAPVSHGEFNGRPALGFNVDTWEHGALPTDSSWRTSSLPILFREAFQFFAQKNFLQPTDMQIALDYPFPLEPRYVRAELIEALKRALHDSEPLSAAAYWWERYLMTSMQEALAYSTIDRVEGSASYAEYIMTAIADIGCEAAEADLMSHVVRSEPAPVPHPTSESYVLGYYAGMLLRQQSQPGWQRRVEVGETPVGVLLDDVEAMPQEENAQLKDEVQMYLSTNPNVQFIAESLNTSIESIQDPFNYRLVLSRNAATISFSILGSYNLTEHEDLGRVHLATRATYFYNTLIETVADVFDIPAPIPCEQTNAQVLSLDSDTLVDNHDGTFSYRGRTVAFSNLKGTVIEQDGYRWLCPEE